MRVRGCASSLVSAPSASADSLTFHAMTLYCVFQWHGRFFVIADGFKGPFGQVPVLEILQVLQDSFADIVGFGATGTPGQRFQAFFNGLRKSNGQNLRLAIQVSHDQNAISPRYRRKAQTASPVLYELWLVESPDVVKPQRPRSAANLTSARSASHLGSMVRKMR
jgi:hypothetical protein